jgi:choline dehydrogenase-like flavoprotein
MDHIAIRAAGSVDGGHRLLRSREAGAAYLPATSHAPEHYSRSYGIMGKVAPATNSGQFRWSLTAQLEVVSRDDNRVDLDPGILDAWGIPSVRIRLQYGSNEQQMAAAANQHIQELASAAGLVVDRVTQSTPGQFVHELGGARMGCDPRSSVLNEFNQCWDVPNVFVADGSAFPSAGWQNPTLTMMALAARASSFIVREFSAGSFLPLRPRRP